MASSKRERELARRRLERQAARRAEAEARRRRRRRNAIASLAGLVAIGLIATLVVPKLLEDDTKTPTASGDCTYTKEGEATNNKVTGLPPATPTTKTGTVTAALETNRGKVTLSLLPEKAPCTVNSFVFLAAQKFFDATPCHRLTSSPSLSVLQCGDPGGTGSGGPGYAFADENLTGATYKKGTVAMANSGPGTNGSQFFLVYADSQLPESYTPFGTITGGLEVLETVAKGGSTPERDGKPKLGVTLTKVTVA